MFLFSSHVTDKKPFLKVDGEWNGVMYANYPNGVSHSNFHTPHTIQPFHLSQDQEVFVDTLNTPTIRKKIKKLPKMEERESRRIWRDVTEALGRKDVEAATDAKHTVSQEFFIVSL